MLKIITERIRQKKRTIAYPKEPLVLPDRFRGMPCIDRENCNAGCEACVAACPTNALAKNGSLTMDLGKCLFCSDCANACPTGAIEFSRDHRLACSTRSGLVLSGQEFAKAGVLGENIRRILGRSLKLRQVSAGGCNACEADLNVLTTVVFDLGRFGVQFVASPRHADGLCITGPVTKNMALALKKTYEATPGPKIVIAVGACAISGGAFIGHGETLQGVPPEIPVDLFVPGCPPHPITILDGILRLLGKKVP